jgi:site-specific recombinase XerD
MKKTTAKPSKKARNTGNVPLQNPQRGFECYLKANGITNQKSLNVYLYTMKRFIGHLKDKSLNDIIQADVNEFVVSMKEHYRHNSMINRCAGLRHLMRFLGKKDIDVKIPASIETKTEENVLTPEEVQQLFQVTATSTRDNCILKVLYYSGLRRSELVALNVEDINFQKKQIIVRNGKGKNNQAEIINISDEALESVQRYISTRTFKIQALFLTDYGKRLSVYGIQYVITKAMEKTEIPKHITAHCFRASLITHLSQNGANTFNIQAQSRHKTLVSLKRYIRPNEQERLQTYETYVPKISNTEIKPREPPKEPVKKPEPKKPENDPMVSNVDEQTALQLRLLEIEKQEIRLKLAKQNPEKNNADSYFQ